MTAMRITDYLVAWRWSLLAIACGLLAAAWGPAQGLQMDRRIEQMFPVGDPSVEAFEILRKRFGGNAVAMLVYRDESLLSPEGLQRAAEIAAKASRIPGVLGVLSLAEVDDALARTRPGNLLGISGPPAILGDESLARGFRELFEGYTHDTSGTYAAVVVMLDPARADLHDSVIIALRNIGDSIGLSDNLPKGSAIERAALVGEPVLVAEGFALVEADGKRLSTVTIIMLGLTTLLMFRSPRWVLAELLVIFWSVQMTRGISNVLGLQLSMVSSMLTAIVTVIAVACVIHVAVRYGVRRGRGDTPLDATQRSLRMVVPPIIWACLTDAAGFAALSISNVGPVRDFGLMMTLGTGMVLAAVLLILPGIMLMPPQKFIAYGIPGDRWIRRFSVRLILAMNGHRLALGIATALMIGLTFFGLRRMETETNFIKNFRAGSELARGYEMVETEFGGAGVWDVILPMPERLSVAYLNSVRELESSLRAIRVESRGTLDARLTKVLSMADADATAGSEGLLSLAPPTVRITGMRVAMPAFVDALLTRADDSNVPGYLRIMLRSPERLPSETKVALINAVTEKVRAHTSNPQWVALFGGGAAVDTDGRVTGYYVLLARLIDSLLSDQWLCLAVAAFVIFLVMWFAFRSLRLAAICMVPNILPVLFVLGVIGLFGVKVNMGAAMIAAVSIGLTIDGSIHFLTGFLSAKRRGDHDLRAVLHAQRRVGLPVLLATIALALGFSVLTTSSFIPTVTFGVLVSAALASGTLANLTLLPLMLMGPPQPVHHKVG